MICGANCDVEGYVCGLGSCITFNDREFGVHMAWFKSILSTICYCLPDLVLLLVVFENYECDHPAGNLSASVLMDAYFVNG